MQLKTLNATIIDWKKSSTKILSLFLSYLPWCQLSEIKENNGKKIYQDQKLHNFTQAKDYIQNHASDIVSKITSFDNYFVNIYTQNKPHSDKPSEEGDKIIFYFCAWLSIVVSDQVLPQMVTQTNYYSRWWSKTLVKPV